MIATIKTMAPIPPAMAPIIAPTERPLRLLSCDVVVLEVVDALNPNEVLGVVDEGGGVTVLTVLNRARPVEVGVASSLECFLRKANLRDSRNHKFAIGTISTS